MLEIATSSFASLECFLLLLCNGFFQKKNKMQSLDKKKVGLDNFVD